MKMYFIACIYNVLISRWRWASFHIVGKMESVRLPDTDVWAIMISSIHKTLSIGPHVQNHAFLYSILAHCWLFVHLVPKGVRTCCSMTRDLQRVWITPLKTNGMPHIPMALQIFFQLPESWVNLPSLELLKDNWLSWQDSSQMVWSHWHPQSRAWLGVQPLVCSIRWQMSWQHKPPTPRIGRMLAVHLTQ